MKTITGESWMVNNKQVAVSNPIACADCSSCVVKCPMGFNIKEKALDIIRLREVPPEFFV